MDKGSSQWIQKTFIHTVNKLIWLFPETSWLRLLMYESVAMCLARRTLRVSDLVKHPLQYQCSQRHLISNYSSCNKTTILSRLLFINIPLHKQWALIIIIQHSKTTTLRRLFKDSSKGFQMFPCLRFRDLTKTYHRVQLLPCIWHPRKLVIHLL